MRIFRTHLLEHSVPFLPGTWCILCPRRPNLKFLSPWGKTWGKRRRLAPWCTQTPGSRPIHTAPSRLSTPDHSRNSRTRIDRSKQYRRKLLGSLAQARREKPAIPPNHVPRGRHYIGVVGPCDPHFPSPDTQSSPRTCFPPETCTRRSNGRGVVDIVGGPNMSGVRYIRCRHSHDRRREYKKASECRPPVRRRLSSRSAVHTSMPRRRLCPQADPCDPFCSRRAPQAAPGAAGRPGSVGRPRAAARARGVWKCGGRSQRGGARWPASVARNMQAFILAQRPCAHPRSYPPLASPQTSNRR